MVFYNTPTSKTLYVPKESIEAYLNDSEWNYYFSNIQPIPTNLTINTEGNGKVYNNGIEIVNGTEYNEGAVNLFILADDGNRIVAASLEDVDVTDQIINHILTIDECKEAGVLKIVFAPEEEAALTVKGHESHSLTHYYKEGKPAKIDLTPSDGWQLYSLLFNGEDVTEEVTDNTYTTPALSGANQLEVVMKSDVGSDVNNVEIAQRKISFRKNGDSVEILNLEEGESISIYNADGTCEYQGCEHTVALDPNNVYILRTRKETLKFSL